MVILFGMMGLDLVRKVFRKVRRDRWVKKVKLSAV